ncbi:hypothetical protein MARBORIA2_14790 [Methanobrevibacter arboriphilus]|jgi:hypothetical protein|uniref:hypothetical protein n=1 Tax=Methanobrevibacter arboriphilus TaxID=39441 RepID=UPI0022EDD6DC|nr:hypothetical protein [Methanobrevibacter arboriphilus]GLI12389.1 hypothetical protein MARBORIA2_14790 [Methanobrevibacter arboriphilus]
MRIKKVKFKIKSTNEERVFISNKQVNNNDNLKVRNIFLNDDLETIKIIYTNNKGETFNYKDIENLEYTQLQL